ncbi:ATP-binding protein [Roseibium sp. SCP14]|uniref:ATP-binding protein n=1 Tax=Roseibium sp. SCP14 TaxID=3141375 RepID=UPI003339A5B9
MATEVQIVTVGNDLSDLPAVYAALEAFSTEAGLSDSVRRSLMLIVEELFNNTVSYGYPDGEPDEIAVSASLRANQVELTLSDGAIAFDNSATPSEPSGSVNIEALEVGGLGLFLVHQLADQVTTERVGDRNHTTVLLANTAD